MDADQLGILNSLSKGIDVEERDLAFEAIKDVGAGGHFLDVIIRKKISNQLLAFRYFEL